MSKQTRTSERKSTIEKSQELESQLRRREIKAQEKKSKKLANIREKELENFVKEAQEIINLADRLEESETSFGADTTLDPLGALTPDGLARARSVSTGLNRFECGNASSLSPERAGLERNIFGGSLRTINEVFENDKMDNNEYKEKLKQAKVYRRQFNTLLSTFTANDVASAIHKDIYGKKLDAIENKFTEISDWFDSLVVDLEESEENDRVAEIEGIQDEIKNAKRNHEKPILDKLAEVMSGLQVDINQPGIVQLPPATVSQNQDRKLEELKAKAGIKKTFIEDKVKVLIQKIRSFKAPVEMTNDEVRYAIKESKTWEKKYDEIVAEQQKYYEECVPFDDLENEKEQVKENIEALKDALSDKVSLLGVEDNDRGLSCRAENKSKDTVVYPAAFKGELGENVFKFVEEIKGAITDAQVKKSDQVKTLLKYLGGEAKKRCGDHYTDLESALEALKEFYGNAALIWLKTRNEFENAFSNLQKEWGEYGDPARVTAIARVIEFLRQSDHLAKEYPELTSEVYSSSTLSLLRKVLPRDYIEKVNDTISDVSASSEEKMSSIKSFLERKKTSALMGVESLKTNKNPRFQTPQETGKSGVRDPLGIRTQATAVSSTVHINHSCIKSRTCNQNWGLLGCTELYKLSSVDERRKYCREANCCFRCGIPFRQGDFVPSRQSRAKVPVKHRCDWNGDKADTKCTSSGCFFGAATCEDHQSVPNATQELLKWLQSQKIRHNLFAVPPVVLGGRKDRNPKTKDSQDCSNHGAVSDNEVTLKLKQKLAAEHGCEDAVHPIPEGDGMFMFTLTPDIKGNPLQTFMDTGANSYIMKTGNEKRLISVRISQGPVSVSVAGGLEISASGEYGALIPLADGTFQAVRGLCMDTVVGKLPYYKLKPLLSQIKEENPNNQHLRRLNIPKVLGGDVDLLLGIKYLRIMPKPVHVLPCGLTVFESVLKPFNKGETAVIGGPVEAFESICNSVHSKTLMRHMVNLCSSLKSYKPSIDYFPSDHLEEEYMMGDNILDSYCTCHSAACDQEVLERVPVALASNSAQLELQKFLKLQEAGLDVSYRCRKCRNCQKCKGGGEEEKLSLRQEAEQELIRESINLDLENGEATAKLPFIQDPNEKLNDNKGIAKKRLDSIINKYKKDTETKKGILDAWKKLEEKGHLKFLKDLTKEEISLLSEGVSYYIPWNVAFKDSLSTPIRPVFDASATTSSGNSLNSIIAKGVPDLVKLLSLLLSWQMGLGACVADISQFYPTINLVPEHWKYQRVLLREGLEPDGRLKEAVIIKLIFGVLSVSSLSEEVVRRFALSIENEYPEVAKFLLKFRYVDDLGRSTVTREEAPIIAIETADLLNKNLNMKIKGGWSFAGQDPPLEVSKDGVSVEFGGLDWIPKLDTFSLRIPHLYFGTKKRGKVPASVRVFDGSSSIEIFTPEQITRRQCTGVVARVWDILGKVAPITLKLRHDLRKLIISNPDWDSPLSKELRSYWISNFRLIENIKDIMYIRCSIPSDAKRTSCRIILKVDAAEVGIMVAAYVGYERHGGTWSCSHLLGKGLLAPEHLTLAQKELQALSSGSDIKTVLQNTLEEWVEEIAVFSDSEIALCWVSYETIKLHVFNRNRVVNITRQLDLEHLYHVQGKENCADTGTRVKDVTANSVKENSEWLMGKDWMRLSLAEAANLGAIKPLKDLKLSHENRKSVKEGVIFDSFEEDKDIFAVVMLAKVDVDKTALREAEAQYVFSPTHRKFKSFIRVTALVLKAIKLFKLGLIARRSREGKACQFDLESLSAPAQKFSLLSNSGSLFQPKSNKTGLNEPTIEEISAALEYMFKTEAKLIKKFNTDRKVKEIAVDVEGILYSKTRIEEAHEMEVVGGLLSDSELQNLLGVNFKVPLVEKHSPVVLPLIMYLHEEFNHKGVESTYKLSLETVKVMDGKPIFKMIGEKCIKCKIKRKNTLKQIMGPLPKYQTSVTPVFYYCLVDMWGPLHVYAPGYEKSTRSSDAKKYKAYFLIFVCAVTGMCNVQLVEGKDTSSILDGCSRFFCEATVPKVMLPDDDGAMLRAFTRGEISLSDISGNLYREKGVHFEVCTPQGHSAHGKVERKIRALQDSLTQSSIENSRCTATGWMTVGKAIENEANNIPIGYLYDRARGDGNPVLRMLRPNSLKGFGLTDRAPRGLFSIPNSPVDLMDRIKQLYDAWYKCWVTSYIPMLLERPKWKLESENLKPNDVIYFKMIDSPLGATWKLGKVEQIKTGKDGYVREVLVAYKIMDEDTDTWRHATVMRPVRECIKLFEIDDTTFLDNLKDIREKAKEILFEEKAVQDNLENDDEVLKSEYDTSKKKKKRLSELEKLKLDSHDTALPRLRSKKFVQNPFVVCSSVTAWNLFTGGVDQEDEGHVVLEHQGGAEGMETLGDERTRAEENDTIDNNDCDLFNDYDFFNDYDLSSDNVEMMFML